MWKDVLEPARVPIRGLQGMPPAFGRYVCRWGEKVALEAMPQVVLLGLEAGAADAVREALFPLAWHFGKTSVGDMGNLADAEEASLEAVLRALRKCGKIAICLGGTHAQWQVVQRVLAADNEHLRTAWLTSAAPADQDHLEPWLKSSAGREEGLSLLGVQAHFLGSDRWDALEAEGVPVLRLSEVRSRLWAAEPLLRDAHLLLCSLSVIKGSESHAAHGWPAGLTTEEAAQLVQFAGLGERLQAACVESDAGSDPLPARVAATMVWYLFEGLSHRRGDYPRDERHLQAFVVHLDDALDLTFYRSRLSGRWWVASRSGRLVACTEEDYRQSVAGELPPRLLRLI